MLGGRVTAGRGVRGSLRVGGWECPPRAGSSEAARIREGM